MPIRFQAKEGELNPFVTGNVVGSRFAEGRSRIVQSELFRKMTRVSAIFHPAFRTRSGRRSPGLEDISDLFATSDNPAPAGADVLRITTEDGVKLRAVRWTAPSSSRGTVALLPGYGEFVEKYFELVGELRNRRFDVVAMDWRGHGLSDRLISDRRKGHVDDFSSYQLDLEALEKQVLMPLCRKPWFALGHSMGGANLLAHAHAGYSSFARIVLSAPMIDIIGLDIRGARVLVEGLDFLGLGGFTIPGGSTRPGALRPFEKNLATSDPGRYARTAEVVRKKPSLALGDPTIGWIHAAARLTRAFHDIDYPRGITTPILVVAAGNDGRIPVAATELFASRLKAGGLVTIPHARHEILMEHDRYRNQFWAAFDAFIPGRKDEFAERLLTAASVPPQARRHF
jgi:lysophospholipase